MFHPFLLSLILMLSLCLVAPPLGGTGAHAAQVQSGDSKDAARAAPSAQKKQPQKSTTTGKTAPHASAHHMGAALGTGSSWYLDGTPRKGRGAVWERGIPMENLSRRRTLGVGGSAGTAGAGVAPTAAQTRELGRELKRDPRSASHALQGRAAAATGGVDTTKGIDSALGEISSYERQPADGSALGLKKPGVPSVQMTTEESSWRNPVTQPPMAGQEVMSTRRNVVGAYADVVKSDDLHVTLGPELHIPDTDPTVKHLSPQQSESSTLGIGMKWQWDF